MRGRLRTWWIKSRVLMLSQQLCAKVFDNWLAFPLTSWIMHDRPWKKRINNDDRLRRKMYYHSFKLFPCFWLVKTTRIIHHNQVLLEFGTNFVILNRWRQNDVKSAAWLQVIEPLTIKTWGRGWVVLVVRTKWRNITLFSAKYCPKTW